MSSESSMELGNPMHCQKPWWIIITPPWISSTVLCHGYVLPKRGILGSDICKVRGRGFFISWCWLDVMSFGFANGSIQDLGSKKVQGWTLPTRVASSPSSFSGTYSKNKWYPQYFSTGVEWTKKHRYSPGPNDGRTNNHGEPNNVEDSRFINKSGPALISLTTSTLGLWWICINLYLKNISNITQFCR